MENLEALCDATLQKAQEKGGRINAITFQAIMRNDAKAMHLVRTRLQSLDLI